MVSIERSAGTANQELDALRKEKHNLELELKRTQNADKGANKSTTLHFEYSQTMDLPPRVRALMEDSRVLKEQVRSVEGSGSGSA
jgi:hypothetical protein